MSLTWLNVRGDSILRASNRSHSHRINHTEEVKVAPQYFLKRVGIGWIPSSCGKCFSIGCQCSKVASITSGAGSDKLQDKLWRPGLMPRRHRGDSRMEVVLSLANVAPPQAKW